MKWKWVPNFVSSLRVIASPFLAYCKSHNRPDWAFGLMVFIGLTDYADGALAIWLDARNDFGKRWMDPLCDFAAALGVAYGFVFQDENYNQRLPIAITLVVAAALLKLAKEQWWWQLPRLKAFAYGFSPIYYCVCVGIFMHAYGRAALDPTLMLTINWLLLPTVMVLTYFKRHRLSDWFGSLSLWLRSFSSDSPVF